MLFPAAPSAEITTLIFTFCARADTPLISLEGSTYGWTLEIAGGALLLTGHTRDVSINLDMEDTAELRDESWHSVAITTGIFGSKIYLDGYQVFSTTANLSPAHCQASSYRYADSQIVTVEKVAFYDHAMSDQQICALAIRPRPLVQFAASHLSARDISRINRLYEGSIAIRFRVRGAGQHGVIFAASSGEHEVISLSIDRDGIVYKLCDREGYETICRAHGRWDDGHWVDLVVKADRGAVDIYVNGYLEVHHPGQVFFADTDDLDMVVIGQDTRSDRLFGEVRHAAIYPIALNDSQIKQLSAVEPVSTQCLFDAGYAHSVSYRIPSLLTTQSGVVIAGCDQRETIPNDAPNSINFVIRRSLDSGLTWEEIQPTISYPGSGMDGASVIDSCLVQDESSGRIFVIIDHFPGGIGQPNAERVQGVDETGRFVLYDDEGHRYRWREDGAVIDSLGQPTSYRVDEQGNVTQDGQARGNVFLARGVDENESLFTARTSYVQMIYSDDDGQSWSKPVNLDHQIKEEWMTFLGTGPGNGIQLRFSEYAGRLLIPVYFNNETWLSMSCAVIYSDDGGKTWRRGQSTNDGRIINGETIDARTIDDPTLSTYESTIVERADGAVVIFMRNQHPSGKVARAISYDGGYSWSDVDYVEQLDEIFSQPNAISCRDECHPDRIVFANASQLMPYRGRGVLRLSQDGGRTWAASRTINPGHYVYQCMTYLPDGYLGILWEREMQGLYFTRLPLSWFGI